MVALLVEESLADRAEVVAVGTLAAARRELAAGRFDCLVLDLSLPDGEGSVLLDEVAGLDAPAVVVLTGQGERSLALRLLRAGVEDFLEKSQVDRDALVRSVQYALERKAARNGSYAEMQSLRLAAQTDTLTGLLNRRGLTSRLAPSHERGRAALLVDLDHFKEINDVAGHDIGDAVLRSVADGIRAGCRSTDIAARVGGDEFLVVLPTDDLDDARTAAARIKAGVDRRLAGLDALSRLDLHATISVGVAQVPPEVTDTQDLLALCTDALHASKRGGRDQISVAQAGGAQPRSLGEVVVRPLLDAASGRRVGAELLSDAGNITATLLGLRERSARAAIEREGLQRRLAAATHLRGHILLPLLIDAAEDDAVLGLLEGHALRHPDQTVVACLWAAARTMPAPRAAQLARRLRKANVTLGVSRVGHGETALEQLLALGPSLLRLDARLCAAMRADGDAVAQAARLAQLSRALGAKVVAPSADPGFRRLAATVGIDWVSGRETEPLGRGLRLPG